jgi:hypothetical protein
MEIAFFLYAYDYFWIFPVVSLSLYLFGNYLQLKHLHYWQVLSLALPGAIVSSIFLLCFWLDSINNGFHRAVHSFSDLYYLVHIILLSLVFLIIVVFHLLFLAPAVVFLPVISLFIIRRLSSSVGDLQTATKFILMVAIVFLYIWTFLIAGPILATRD